MWAKTLELPDSAIAATAAIVIVLEQLAIIATAIRAGAAIVVEHTVAAASVWGRPAELRVWATD